MFSASAGKSQGSPIAVHLPPETFVPWRRRTLRWLGLSLATAGLQACGAASKSTAPIGEALVFNVLVNASSTPALGLLFAPSLSATGSLARVIRTPGDFAAIATALGTVSTGWPAIDFATQSVIVYMATKANVDWTLSRVSAQQVIIASASRCGGSASSMLDTGVLVAQVQGVVNADAVFAVDLAGC